MLMNISHLKPILVSPYYKTEFKYAYMSATSFVICQFYFEKFWMGVQIIMVAKHYCTTYMFLSNELSLFDYCVVSFFASRVILFFFSHVVTMYCVCQRNLMLYILIIISGWSIEIPMMLFLIWWSVQRQIQLTLPSP